VDRGLSSFLSLRCKSLEILVVVQFVKPVHRCAMNVEILLGLDSVPHLLHAARRQSGLAAHFYGLRSLRSKSVSRYPISRVKLLEVPRVGGFSLGQNGHGFTVGLRPNPGKQVVDAIEAF
jgi:hypothetical protein